MWKRLSAFRGIRGSKLCERRKSVLRDGFLPVKKGSGSAFLLKLEHLKRSETEGKKGDAAVEKALAAAQKELLQYQGAAFLKGVDDVKKVVAVFSGCELLAVREFAG